MLCPLRLEIADLESSPSIVDADLIKKHVRVDYADDDTLLDVYLRAAALWCEGATHRTIFRRRHEWVLRDFEPESPYAIRLPRGRTASVESVTYSLSGSTTTLTGPSSSPVGADYQEDLRGDNGGIVMPLRGTSWPVPDADVPSPVVINFTAGWTAEELPADLLHAIMFAIADAYDLRGSSDFTTGMLNDAGPRLMAREALVSPYRLIRWF